MPVPDSQNYALPAQGHRQHLALSMEMAELPTNPVYRSGKAKLAVRASDSEPSAYFYPQD
jgi:hypothetical protein